MDLLSQFLNVLINHIGYFNVNEVTYDFNFKVLSHLPMLEEISRAKLVIPARIHAIGNVAREGNFSPSRFPAEFDLFIY